jgi:hypothetical protein
MPVRTAFLLLNGHLLVHLPLTVVSHLSVAVVAGNGPSLARLPIDRWIVKTTDDVIPVSLVVRRPEQHLSLNRHLRIYLPLTVVSHLSVAVVTRNGPSLARLPIDRWVVKLPMTPFLSLWSARQHASAGPFTVDGSVAP